MMVQLSFILAVMLQPVHLLRPANRPRVEPFISDNYTSSCITTGNQDTICRFNTDCCSKLCTTFVDLPTPKCIENTPENHVSDSTATHRARLPFKENTFVGMERWRNKVAVVTGAASGIGFALANRLCGEGMIVVGTDINEEGVKKTADHCPKGNYFSFAADLRKEQDITNLFKYVDQTVGRVDVLVNNAGVEREFSLIDVSSEGLRTTFDLDVLAPVLCTREALKIMMAKNITSGYIMYTNSVHGSKIFESAAGKPSRHLYIYEAAKHALKVIREGLRQELRARGSKIRVGEVSPGSVITNIPDSFTPRDSTDKATVKSIFQASASINNFDRMSPDDIAEAFVYMLQAPERMDINTILIENMPK